MDGLRGDMVMSVVSIKKLWTAAQGWSGFSRTAKRPDLNGAAHRLRARPADYISGSPDKANKLLFVSLPLGFQITTVHTNLTSK